MAVSIIAALDPDGVIGYNATIPWDIPEERQLFHQLTKDSVLLMGRITYESIGKPLPNRITIIVSKTPLDISNVQIAPSLAHAISLAESYNKPIYIAGGAQLYTEALTRPEVDTLYLSHLHNPQSTNLQKDNLVHFPAFTETEWDMVDEKVYQTFTFKTYKRHA